jgi:hypothetical protein
MPARLPLLLLVAAVVATALVPVAFAAAPAPITDLRATRAEISVILTWTHRDAAFACYGVLFVLSTVSLRWMKTKS